MKNGMAIGDFARELARQVESKKDVVVDTRSLRMEAQPIPEVGVPERPRLRITGIDASDARTLSQDDTGLLRIGDVAHSQIAARTGIPKRYYDTMITEAPELLARNVNHWFEAKPENRMVRTLDGRARAFLSDRYQRIDNFDVANMALPILEKHEGLRVVSCQVTESRMYLKAVSERIHADVKVGDTVQAGVMITNSEIGHGALAISPITMRLVCLNGMVVTDQAWRRNHVGAKADMGEELYALLSDETRALDDQATLLKVRDLVGAALDQTAFNRQIERMRASAEDKITGDPIKAVEVLAQKMTFTKGETSGIMRRLIEGGDLSRWGMLNAVTRASQDVEDYDRATDYEIIGGKLLDLRPNEWSEIAEAA